MRLWGAVPADVVCSGTARCVLVGIVYLAYNGPKECEGRNVEVYPRWNW